MGLNFVFLLCSRKRWFPQAGDLYAGPGRKSGHGLSDIISLISKRIAQ